MFEIFMKSKLLLLVLVCGCGQQTPQTADHSKRFKIEWWVEKQAYWYLVTDTLTKREFLHVDRGGIIEVTPKEAEISPPPSSRR